MSDPPPVLDREPVDAGRHPRVYSPAELFDRDAHVTRVTHCLQVCVVIAPPVLLGFDVIDFGRGETQAIALVALAQVTIPSKNHLS